MSPNEGNRINRSKGLNAALDDVDTGEVEGKHFRKEPLEDPGRRAFMTKGMGVLAALASGAFAVSELYGSEVDGTGEQYSGGSYGG